MTDPRLAAALAALLGVIVGLWLGGHPDRLPSGLRDVFVDEPVALNGQAVHVIEDSYFKPVKGSALQDASVEGMVRSLRRRYHDRFSHYFDPKTFDRFEESAAGRFSGVGLSVTQVKRGLRVATVFNGSPAKRAGVVPGDLIVAVNGRSIAGEDAEASTARIKGKPGTAVKLTVIHRGRRRVLGLERAELRVPVVVGRIRRAGGRPVAYVRFSDFVDGAHGELRAKLRRLFHRGARGLVLDLRGNGGGLLSEAVLTSSLFVDKGVIVTTDARTQGRRVYRALGDSLPRRPMVVLIDRDTASAAEILTAALSDHHVATVVGTRSFGKGVFQQVLGLDNGGALDLTIGEYLTPEGTSLAGKGVHPDVQAKDDPDTRPDEGLRTALRVLGEKLRSR